MSIQKTTTELETLKINYLTQAMYKDALENDEIEENELYMSSYTPNYVIDIEWIELQQTEEVSPFGPHSSGYYYHGASQFVQMEYPDYLAVTFNNVKYICEKYVVNDTLMGYGAPGVSLYPSAGDIDFTDYPFGIYVAGTTSNTNKLWRIWTGTAASYTLQIDCGYQSVTVSSDFEQAVIYICNGGNN